MTDQGAPIHREWGNLLLSLQDEFGSVETIAREGLRKILRGACRTVGSAESSLMTPDPEGDHLVFFVSVNRDLEEGAITVPIGRSIAGYVYSTGNLVAVGDVSEEMSDLHYGEVDNRTGTRTRAYLAVPIFAEDQPQAVLTFVNRAQGPADRRFSREEIHQALVFADLCGAGLRFHDGVVTSLQAVKKDLKICAIQAENGFLLEEREGLTPPERILRTLKRLGPEDQSLIAEIVETVARHRNGNPVETR